MRQGRPSARPILKNPKIIPLDYLNFVCKMYLTWSRASSIIGYTMMYDPVKQVVFLSISSLVLTIGIGLFLWLEPSSEIAVPECNCVYFDGGVDKHNAISR